MPAWLEDDGPYPGNGSALQALRAVLFGGEAVAFVGAGASAPTYPVWRPFLAGLISFCERRGLGQPAAARLRDQLHRALFVASEAVEANADAAFAYIEKTFAPPRRGAAHTPTHAALMRLPFRGYVTTNYDVGLERARSALFPDHEATTVDHSVNDPAAEDAWRGAHGDAFAPGGRRVLHLHGRYDEGDRLILSLEQYRTAYAGACRRIMQSLWERRGLVLIGYGFADPWIEFVTQSTMLGLSDTSRHFAIIGVEEGQHEDARFFEKSYGVRPVFYPVGPRGDHSALVEVLAALEVEEGSVPQTAVAARGRERGPHRWETTLGRRSMLLQYLGMTGACGLVLSPFLGTYVSVAWISVGFSFAVARLGLEALVRRREERRNAHWRALIRPATVFLEEMVVCTMTLPLWLVGGTAAGFAAALILFISLTRVIVTTVDSTPAVFCGLAAPGLMLAVAPVFLASFGGSPSIITATAVLVGVTISASLSIWQRMRQALGY